MLKPPVTIDSLTQEWMEDASIDKTEPSREMAKVPNLHAKYLNIMMHHMMLVKKITYEYNNLKKIKIEYYSGDLNNPDDLAEYGWEPWRKKVLKQDIPIYLDSDSDLNRLLIKKAVQQEIVDYCERVLKEISNRTWQIKTIADWEKYIQGN